MQLDPYVNGLPPGVRSRMMDNGNGLRMHVLEAGHQVAGRPSVLLLHGFPEIAYSWRRVMPRLAEGGYHVIAPDQRGYGRTTGWNADYDGDLASFRPFNIVRDALGLLHSLGLSHVHAVVGHDFGSLITGWCALLRPDVFRSAVMMSAPFPGPPTLQGAPARRAIDPVHAELAALDPARKHYHHYYATREANADMLHAPQGLHAFLRAYFHHKSADWVHNQPYRLSGWRASELAKMPTYYIMPRDLGMAQTVAPHMPTAAQIEDCRWLTEQELAVYSSEFGRTGFQGGLQWYRCRVERVAESDLELFSGRTIDVPTAFIAGNADWGVFQSPGAFEKMQNEVCTQMRLCRLVDGAGHWVQQEQSDAVSELLLQFMGASHSR